MSEYPKIALHNWNNLNLKPHQGDHDSGKGILLLFAYWSSFADLIKEKFWPIPSLSHTLRASHLSLWPCHFFNF